MAKPRIAVVGAGAVGGIVAGFAAKAGCDVELVCKHPEIVRKIGEEGLRISGVRGNHTIKLPAVTRISDLSGPKDVVFHATKATDLISAAREILPFLKDDSLVASLQNGICEEALSEVVGRERVVGCVVGWGATMEGPAELVMTSMGEFVIGCLDKRSESRLGEVKEILETILPVTVTADILEALYSKLIINSCITALGAISGLTLGEMLRLKQARKIFIRIVREAMDVADTLGLKVPPYANKFDYYNFFKGPDWKRHLVIRLMGFKYRRLKSSMLQSLERGRPTEIDFLNGYIGSKGKECGVATPVNDSIVEMIKEIERGSRSIGIANVRDEKVAAFQ